MAGPQARSLRRRPPPEPLAAQELLSDAHPWRLRGPPGRGVSLGEAQEQALWLETPRATSCQERHVAPAEGATCRMTRGTPARGPVVLGPRKAMAGCSCQGASCAALFDRSCQLQARKERRRKSPRPTARSCASTTSSIPQTSSSPRHMSEGVQVLTTPSLSLQWP